MNKIGMNNKDNHKYLIKLEDTAARLGGGAFGEVTEIVDFISAQVRAKKTLSE